MKRLFFAALLVLCASAASAKKYIITCTLQSSCPMTVNIGGRSYTLTVADPYAKSAPRAIVLEIDGRMEWSAYDKDGRRITQCSTSNTFDDQGNLQHVRMILGGAGYTFSDSASSSSYDSGTTEYETGDTDYTGDTAADYSDSGDYSPAYSPSNMSTSDYAKATAISTIGGAMSNFGSSAGAMTGVYSSYYPYLAFNIGASRFGGQYARVKTCLGGAGGFTLMGGVGREWIFNRHNEKALLWHIGMGYYMTNESGSEFGMNVLFGETPVCPNKGLLLELSYGYFFGYTQRFGIYASLGVGGGNLDAKKPKFILDVNIGVAVKLLSRKQ